VKNFENRRHQFCGYENMQTINSDDAPTYIVVIGASAGGLTALTEIVGQLNPDMDIAVFIVLHLSTTGIGDYL